MNVLFHVQKSSHGFKRMCVLLKEQNAPEGAKTLLLLTLSCIILKNRKHSDPQYANMFSKLYRGHANSSFKLINELQQGGLE
jgi:hypothetical protein